MDSARCIPPPSAPIASEEVLLNTLDAFASEAEVRRVDLVKIDVEGAELAVLRGWPRRSRDSSRT